MENKYYIYYHFNSKNKKLFYIGVGYNKRAYQFKSRSKHYCNYMKKYGDPIVVLAYENMDRDEAFKKEIELIKFFGRKGYKEEGILINKSSGGKTSGSGVKQNRSQEWCDNISKGKIGKTTHTQDGKDRISEKNSKKLIQYNNEGEIINKYKSVIEASEVLKIDISKIYTYLNSIRKYLIDDIILKYEIKPTKRKGKTILLYDKEGKFIKEFISINQAQLELKITGIGNVLNNKNVKYEWKEKYEFKFKE